MPDVPTLDPGDAYDENEVADDDPPEPDPISGITLVEAQYEYSKWGDDRWLIASGERMDGDRGVYDYLAQT